MALMAPIEQQERNLFKLVSHAIGAAATDKVFNLMTIPTAFNAESKSDMITRAEMAQALNMLLFHDLLSRVPTGRRYTEEVASSGGKVFHDHGALRTVRWPETGHLPAGEVAFTRILEPLGFRLNGTFPLDRIGMTGRSYAHEDFPDQIAQFFVSELHPEKFSATFQQAVSRVLGASIDPLTPNAQRCLHELKRDNRLALSEAAQLLPELVGCFARQHAIPALVDYEILLNESAEMAWIATEGNMFNHVTDRVADLQRLTDTQKAMGRPMKPSIEVSKTGRIKQTAFKADPVYRQFVDADGQLIEREVPGSFYEFISRDYDSEAREPNNASKLDLGFDASNAQGIFKMTAAAPMAESVVRL